MSGAQAARAAQQIAVLRDLYRRLGEALDDPDRRGALWNEIVVEHANLKRLVDTTVAPPPPD